MPEGSVLFMGVVDKYPMRSVESHIPQATAARYESEMSKILKDLSPSALVKANEANRYAITPFYYDWPGLEVHSASDLYWGITDISFMLCNAAFKAKLRPENVDSAIQDFITAGRTRNVPLQWILASDSEPPNLYDNLLSHGFREIGEAPAMAVDLLTMKENMHTPPSLTISEVEDFELLKVWCQISAISFGMPEGREHALYDWLSTCIKLGLAMKFYLGNLNGKEVATSMLFLAEGVAGIYFVATLPEARGQGIGCAITLKPLLEAREMGYRIGILQASKLGLPVYLNIGFKEYSKIASYRWSPPKGTLYNFKLS